MKPHSHKLPPTPVPIADELAAKAIETNPILLSRIHLFIADELAAKAIETGETSSSFGLGSIADELAAKAIET